MNKMKIALICFGLASGLYAQKSPSHEPVGPLPRWNDVSIVEVNRLSPRAWFQAYPEASGAEFGADTPWEKSLNGTWKFHWVDTPDNRPTDFYKPGYDVSQWSDIPVPMSWQSAGFGVPIYQNSQFPFNSEPPYINQVFNPVGSYKRKFTVPEAWSGSQVLIRFAGVDSAFTFWVNGREVGYSEGSRAGAEFDITDFLQPGENDLAVEVIRFSSGAWLEDQDFFRLSGIFRDVDLIARPAGQRLRDFTLRTPLHTDYTHATLELRFELENATGGQIAISVTDADGKTALEESVAFTGSILSVDIPVSAPKLWSAEIPNLYTLTITHTDAAGKVIEVVPWRFGFRSVEIQGDRLLVNGKPVIIAGVNRHEHSARYGHYCSHDEMVQDILTMKRLNFNAVRTSHYPHRPEFYALCDEYGLYVTDEANIEAHGDKKMPNRPEMALSHHHRMQRMVQRDKNYTSIITWSLGNESGKEGAHIDNYNWTKENDYRPVGYQRHSGRGYTDYNAEFYKKPADVLKWTIDPKTNQSLIQCEYAHAMGNSSGNMKEYWDIHWADNNAQGAFAWDWMDQGLELDVPECSWVNIEGIDPDKLLLIEGHQPSGDGLQGILYFGRGSEPEIPAEWTVKMLLRTAPKTDDTFGFFPLFAKDGLTGGVFMERNCIVFETFSRERTRIMIPLPDSFFDSDEHTLTVSKNPKEVIFYLDGIKIGDGAMQSSQGCKAKGLLAFGPGVGTPLVRAKLIPSAPTMLAVKLLEGSMDPAAAADKDGIVDIDFRKPVTVLKKAPAGGSFYAYGGYFEERRGISTPGNFCMNGVVDSTCNPHPGAYAFKYVQQPFDTTAVDVGKGRLKVRNRNYFKALDSDYRCLWNLTADGDVIQNGAIEGLIIQPQEEKEITIPWKEFTPETGVEYRLQVTYELAGDTSWARAGHRVAWDQFQVAFEPKPSAFSGGELRFEEAGDILTLSGKTFKAGFSKSKGTLVSYAVEGRELLAGPLTPDFWRAATDNDRGGRMNGETAWRELEGLSSTGLTHQAISASQYRIEAEGPLGTTGSQLKQIFDVHADGQIEIEIVYSAPSDEKLDAAKKKQPVKKKRTNDPILLRFGMRVPVASDLTTLDWYGHGPRETYIDRNFELIGRYSKTVDQLFTDYSRPQESGNLYGVRQALLHNGVGAGLEIVANAETPLEVSVRRYPHQLLEEVQYSYQLPPSDEVYLNIDHRVMGVGGITSWGTRPLIEYQLLNKPMSYKFILRGRGQ